LFEKLPKNSPDGSEKPTAKARQFFLAKKSDQRKLFFCLEKWRGWRGLVANSWMELLKEKLKVT
jgi:hypothetical protein